MPDIVVHELSRVCCAVPRFCTACQRLLQNADTLLQFLDGLEVRVSEVNIVAPDGSHIDIAWDFEI